MGVLKADQEARDAFPTGAYDGVPKSVFALLAYHLARRLAGIEHVEDHDAALRILTEEANALHGARILTESQARAARQHLREVVG